MLQTDYKFGEVHNLAAQVESCEQRVHFNNIFTNPNGGVVMMAFKSGQKLETHTAPAEVMVNVLEGQIKFKMLEKEHIINAGEFLLMGADVPHSVEALADSKVMLVKIKP